MREDMAKVLVESARRGARIRLKRRKLHQRARHSPETSPRREPMSRGRGTKYLNEHLAPLERFLAGNVGRPWDAVYSEICARLRASNAVQQHVRDHLSDFVAMKTWIEDGDVVSMGDPLNALWWKTRFYVCPRSGLLRERARTRKRHRWFVPDPDVRWDGPDRQLRRIGGLWFAFALAPIPARIGPGDRDFYFRKPLRELVADPTAPLAAAYERAGVFAIAKRSIGKDEILRVATLPMGRRKVSPW